MPFKEDGEREGEEEKSPARVHCRLMARQEKKGRLPACTAREWKKLTEAHRSKKREADRYSGMNGEKDIIAMLCSLGRLSVVSILFSYSMSWSASLSPYFSFLAICIALWLSVSLARVLRNERE